MDADDVVAGAADVVVAVVGVSLLTAVWVTLVVLLVVVGVVCWRCYCGFFLSPYLFLSGVLDELFVDTQSH